MKPVQVLLSTYNGEKYIETQLDSIIQQDYENISILIRDDGSTDQTISILEQYSQNYGNICFYKGKNVGVVKSFFDLMLHASEDAEYISFSDQDDYWLPDKVSVAVKKIETKEKRIGNGVPILYACETEIVDGELNEVKVQIKQTKKRACFGNALVENICTGCTCILNRSLFDKIKDNLPEYTEMHDWWIYLTAAYFGKVIYDEKPYIKYRQHENNVLGSRKDYISEFKIRCKQFQENHGKISKQIREFDRVFGETKNKKGMLLKYVTNYKKIMKYRMKILISNDIFRQRKMDNFIFKALFLLGLR